MTNATDTAIPAPQDDAGRDPSEDRRETERATIKAVLERELASFLDPLRSGRRDGATKGHPRGHRERQLTGTFGAEMVRVPSARIEDDAGTVTELRSKGLPVVSQTLWTVSDGDCPGFSAARSSGMGSTG